MPSFTLTIPDAKFTVVKESLLRLFPIPIDPETGLPEIDPDTGSPWTENNWLKNVVVTQLIILVKKGRRKFRIGEGEETFQGEKSDFDDSFDIT